MCCLVTIGRDTFIIASVSYTRAVLHCSRTVHVGRRDAESKQDVGSCKVIVRKNSFPCHNGSGSKVCVIQTPSSSIAVYR